MTEGHESAPEAPTPRSLHLLRSMIDALDRDLLHIMTQRMALVGEVAAYKRRHGVRIRDAAREREILDDRRARAQELGLPPGEIESIFRVLLRTSREHQAAMRAEVPLDETPRVVAIIGGHGKIGRLLARMLADLGHRVLIADVDTDLRAEEAACAADVTIVSVPIADTVGVIRQVGPCIRPEAMIMDVTSVKEAPMAAMLESTSASVVGTHPMFGPSVHSLQGQRLILCRGRGEAWTEWTRRTFESRGLTVTEATPTQHDRMMSVVQVLTHFQTQALGRTLATLGVPLAETMPFTSPAYLLELYVTARHFAQDPALYAAIEMNNPRTREVTSAFERSAADVADIIARGDSVAFSAMSTDVRGFFGEFTGQALEQSSYLIDRIVERS